MNFKGLFGGVAAGVLALAVASPANALTINLVNTGGVEMATDAYAGFRAAADFWESVLLDKVTVNFRVGFTTEILRRPRWVDASSSAANMSTRPTGETA